MIIQIAKKLLITFKSIESETVTCFPEVQPPRENINNKLDITLSIVGVHKCI